MYEEQTLKPWECDGSPWKTEASYYAWLRGQLRRIWSNYPIRNEFKKKAGRLVTQAERNIKLFHPSTKRVFLCPCCDRVLPVSKAQVDHIVGGISLKTEDDILNFVKHVAMLSPDHMQLLCITCNKIKGVGEGQGWTFERALDRMVMLKLLKHKDTIPKLLNAGLLISPKRALEQNIQEHLIDKMDRLTKIEMLDKK